MSSSAPCPECRRPFIVCDAEGCYPEYSGEHSQLLLAAEKAKVERLERIPDGFDPSISAEQYFKWCKHHQRSVSIAMSEKRLANEKVERLEEALKEYAGNDYPTLEPQRIAQEALAKIGEVK